MKIVSNENLEIMNFSDFVVLKTSLDTISKSISFYLNGACYLKNGKRFELGAGYFSIKSYESIYITSYDAKERTETVLSENDFESLCDLCEIDVMEKHLILKGFSKKNSNWVELSITGGEAVGEFENIE